MAWTDERVDILRKLWTEGHSASHIARTLGEVTRNAVIGKVHRLGLSGRATPSRPVKRPPRLARPKPIVANETAVAATDATTAKADLPDVQARSQSGQLQPVRLENGEKANVLNLQASMCKWPIGDPADPEFAFCGRHAKGGPYCAEHAKIAFQPARKRERKRNEDRDYIPRIAG